MKVIHKEVSRNASRRLRRRGEEDLKKIQEDIIKIRLDSRIQEFENTLLFQELKDWEQKTKDIKKNLIEKVACDHPSRKVTGLRIEGNKVIVDIV